MRQFKQEQKEYIDKLVNISRVAKVVKGGRRFGFAALVVVGDGKGFIGVGHGKAKEVPESIKKATINAKRNVFRVPLREGRTLHHDIHGYHGAGHVFLRSASPGTGIIAGGPVRQIFEALGVQDIVGKSIGSNNPYNMVYATIEALKNVITPKFVADKRNKKITEIVKRRKNQGASDVKEDNVKEDNNS